jgi:hypothetical protein
VEPQVESQPSPLIERLVRVLTPPEAREYVLGDLRERYVSPLRYLRDAVSVLSSAIGTRLRRTTHLLGIVVGVAFYWFGVFYGNMQSHWIVAAIPTVAAVFAGVIRDTYRVLPGKQPVSALLDVAVFVGSALLSQAVVALVAPDYLLNLPALTVGLPIGAVLVFLVRWQASGLVPDPRLANARQITMQDLMREVRGFEKLAHRGVRMEIGAAFVVAVAFTVYAWLAPDMLTRLGHALIASAAVFIAWWMRGWLRGNPVPDGLSFEETVRIQRERLAIGKRVYQTAIWWYVLPLSLGPILLVIRSVIDEPNPWPPLFLRLAALMGVALALQFMQRLFANGMQKRMDQLALVTERQPD